jgi:hypothetical protein
MQYFHEEMLDGFKNLTARFDGIVEQLVSLEGVPNSVARLEGVIAVLPIVFLLLLHDWVSSNQTTFGAASILALSMLPEVTVAATAAGAAA